MPLTEEESSQSECDFEDDATGLPKESVVSLPAWCRSKKYLICTETELSQLYYLREEIINAKKESPGQAGVLLSIVSDLLFEVYMRHSNWPPFVDIINMAKSQGLVTVVGEGDDAVISLAEIESNRDGTNASVDVEPGSSEEKEAKSACTSSADDVASSSHSSETLCAKIPTQKRIGQDDLSQTALSGMRLIEYIEESPAYTLQALCDSGGMCDALFAKLNTEFNISPGEWWSCYSGGRGEMSDAVMKMLDEKTAKTWREVSCPYFQQYPSNKQSRMREVEECPMHPIINQDLLIFWSELRRQLSELYGMHHRTLQAHCSRGSAWIVAFDVYTTELTIPTSHWKDCYASGRGCRIVMAAKITSMFSRFIMFMSQEEFKVASEKHLLTKSI